MQRFQKSSAHKKLDTVMNLEDFSLYETVDVESYEGLTSECR